MKYHTAVPIGRGGMGEVLRAWDPTLNRPVALKFLRSNDPELEERMLREARSQARVHHPNVCPVYEVGRHQGRIFIAMQLIDGRPLDEAAADLGPEQKVALMRTVVEAVHAAHAVGLIHRDLKPANILVERTPEGDLKPWVLDFGIAREREVPGATVTGQVLGTPGYLSPEQARGEVSAIDRRSDVFSLGVVLYELLAGRRPHPGDSEATALVSLLEGEPVPLRRWAPHLPRDLETVVMTCLEHDRERRYESARALAEDLDRYLHGEPIQARPTGVLRRWTIRARRYPAVAGLLAAAGLAVTALVLGLAGFWIKYTVDLRRERDVAQEARREAERREREAAKVTESLVALFELADPSRTPGEALTARQLLAEGERRLERELASEPLRLGRLLDAMATSYLGLGMRNESERLARRALELRQAAAGPDSLEVADSLATLAEALRAENVGETEASFLRALEVRSRALGLGDPSTARVQVKVAELQLSRGAVDEADARNRQAWEVLHRLGEEDSPPGLLSLDLAARIHARRGEFGDAIALFQDLLDRRRRLYGRDHPSIVASLNNLAFAQMRAGDLGGSEAHYRAALEGNERLVGRDHPDSLRVMLNLAGVLDLQARDDETRALLEEVVELRRAQVPLGDWKVGRDLVGGLGRFHAQRRRWGAAEGPVREGLAIFEAALGSDHTWVALARGQLAACLFGLGRAEEAAELLDASQAVLARAERLSGHDRLEVERVAEYLEASGRADLGRWYRVLLERLAAGVGSNTPSPPG